MALSASVAAASPELGGAQPSSPVREQRRRARGDIEDEGDRPSPRALLKAYLKTSELCRPHLTSLSNRLITGAFGFGTEDGGGAHLWTFLPEASVARDLTAREHERALRKELSALESAFELHVGVYDELREEVQTRIDESWERVAADQGAGASTASFQQSALSESLAMLSQDLAMKAAIVAGMKKRCEGKQADRSELLTFGAVWAERPYLDEERLGMALALEEEESWKG